MILLLLLGAFADIEAAYSDAEFEQVAALVAKQNTSQLTAGQKKRMYELGGFAEFFLGHEPKAAHYFELMFQTDPQATVDERRYPPKAVAFYKQQKEKQKQVVVQPRPAAAASTGWSPLALIPFGIGHLVLGDIPAGVVFLTVPTALIATSIALYWVRQGEKLPGDRYPNKQRADSMQITQDIAGFAAIAVAIYGVIDASLFAQDRVAARRAKVAVLPMGAGLAFAIQY